VDMISVDSQKVISRLLAQIRDQAYKIALLEAQVESMLETDQNKDQHTSGEEAKCDR